MTSSQNFGTYPAVERAPGTGAYSTGEYLAPAAPGSYDVRGGNGEQPSTADVAKDQAANVAGGVGDAAQHVAGVAQEQVSQVTAEAGRQVKQLLAQAQSELSDQAQVQQEKIAGGLHSVGDQLKAMATSSDQPGTATDIAHQAADKAHEFAGWLETRTPGDVLNEVRSFARQRPGVFLAVALGAGLVAGRLARSLATDPDETDNQNGNASAAQQTRPAVGGRAQSALTSNGFAARADQDLYGSGDVPDWTGKSVDDLREGR